VNGVAKIETLLTENLDIWASAIERRSTAGRGRSKKLVLYGIEKLRTLILDLAVRGKLVPQDARDEPASELLKKINKAKLDVPSGAGKPRTNLPQSAPAPFEIPSNWVWTQVSQIGHDWGQTEPQSNFTYIDVGSIDQSAGMISSPSVVGPKDAPSRARKTVRKGSVIYSTVRPYLLNIAVVGEDFEPSPIASTAFAVIHPYNGVSAQFIYRYLRSAAFITYVESCQTGIAYPAINDRQFFSAWFPLPPLAEQHRIVAKVDELMALCDALEAGTYDALEAHGLLVKELLATLTSSKSAEDFAQNWARIETHFDTLFTTEDSIDQLKQTILQLAVMGKLVPQDPSDEPATKLSARIKLEKAKQVLAARTKRQTNSSPIQTAETKFELPLSWEWVRAVDVFGVTSGSTFPASLEKDEGKYPYLKVADMNLSGNELYATTSSRFIDADSKQENGLIPANSIVFPKRGGAIATNKKRLVEFPLFVDLNIMALTIPKEISLHYAYIWLSGIDLASLNTGTSVPQINHQDIEPLPFPLPPRDEQIRIVAKAEELLQVCDDLKSQLSEAQNQQIQFADTITCDVVA
jgi:type I restriction enzyme, S subunit